MLELAEFVTELDSGNLPAEVFAMAQACLLDWLGCALAGAAEPGPRALRNLQSRHVVGGASTVVGSAPRCDAGFAAMHNGFASHALELDDVHLPSASHVSAPVLAVTLALGEELGVGADELTVAFVAGYEAMARIGRPVGLTMISRYHVHPTGFLGYFGAATAAARLLRLSSTDLLMAWGIAGGRAGGLTEVRGTMSKAFFAGHSAEGGLHAARLAAVGFTSAPRIIDGPAGVLAAFGATSGVEPVGDRDWEILENSFKVHASCAMGHPMIEALLDLRRRRAVPGAAVQRVHLGLFPEAAAYLDRPRPADGLDAKFSAQFCAAVALLDGEVSARGFTPERVASADVLALMDKVELHADADQAFEQAHVEIELTDGCRLTAGADIRDRPTKRLDPLADGQLIAKFRDLVVDQLSSGDVDRICEIVERWPAADPDELFDLMRTPATSASRVS